MCGEKGSGMLPSSVPLGSPPRMRGKAANACSTGRAAGITPAYAGKRFCLSMSVVSPKNHPRVCGEKVRGYVKIWNEWGSPPRMRGKARRPRRVPRPLGITPAYAGKSRRKQGKTGQPEDHPRVCGEKLLLPRQTSLVRGSPPRMRGKVFAPNSFLLFCRITPAYAGKRLSP